MCLGITVRCTLNTIVSFTKNPKSPSCNSSFNRICVNPQSGERFENECSASDIHFFFFFKRVRSNVTQSDGFIWVLLIDRRDFKFDFWIQEIGGNGGMAKTEINSDTSSFALVPIIVSSWKKQKPPTGCIQCRIQFSNYQ